MLKYVRLINNYFSLEKNHNNKPLVSIIIATYNRSEILLQRTIPSLLSQTYENIEIIIVGDKCIDNTPKLLSNYSDKRVKFFDLKKRGKYPTEIKYRWFVQGSVPRNKGMKIAKGEWFVFISDDDILFPNHVEILLKNAIKLKVEFLSASYETIKSGEKVIVYPVYFASSGKSIKIGGMQTWIYKSYLKFFKWNVDSWRKKWNRPVDYDLQLRFIDAGVKFGDINEIVYYNPPVEGTNTTGYEAALLADKLN
jgi:glycosyltransferase involved in cell wall biosynthesis